MYCRYDRDILVRIFMLRLFIRLLSSDQCYICDIAKRDVQTIVYVLVKCKPIVVVVVVYFQTVHFST